MAAHFTAVLSSAATIQLHVAEGTICWQVMSDVGKVFTLIFPLLNHSQYIYHVDHCDVALPLDAAFTKVMNGIGTVKYFTSSASAIEASATFPFKVNASDHMTWHLG